MNASCVTLIWGEEEGSFVDVLSLKYLYTPHVEAQESVSNEHTDL